MNYPTVRHEDNRRTLIEWIKDLPIKCIKTIYVKEKIGLGNHYHLKKDEVFFLAKGKGTYMLTTANSYKREWIFEGDCVFVPRGTIHTFLLYPDSILLEAATEPYEPSDEIRA